MDCTSYILCGGGLPYLLIGAAIGSIVGIIIVCCLIALVDRKM